MAQSLCLNFNMIISGFLHAKYKSSCAHTNDLLRTFLTNYFLRGLAAIENKPRSWTNNTYFSHFENKFLRIKKILVMLMAWKSKSDFNICSADFHTFHLFFFRSTKIMHIGSNFFPTKIVKLQFASSKPSVSLRFSWKF